MNVPSSPVDEYPAGDQLGALRRVAELIAQGAERTAVLDAIVAETYRLFPVEFTAMLSYEPDGAASIEAVHNGPAGLAVGERAPHIPQGLVLRVLASGRPARVEAYDGLPGAGVARMRELGISAGAAAPILVNGGLWGVLTAMTCSGPVAPGLEHRVADFAEIAATAVAGAQATYERQGLMDEQAALRRVAELAARGADPQDVFERLTVETSALLPGKTVAVVRIAADGQVVVDAVRHGSPARQVTATTDDDLAAEVRRRGQAARIHADSGGLVAVAVPIHVEGTVWGMVTATSMDGPLGDDAVRCLSPFAEIAAVATAGAKARADLHRIAEEQAALRRVAEIVARGGTERQLFDAVVEEASALIDDEATTLAEFTGERRFAVVATRGGPAAVGSTIDVPEDDRGLVAEILRTRQPARLDDYGTRHDPSYARADFDVGSRVAVPIMVHERMWGMLGVFTTGRPLPAGTETRLGQFADLVAAALANIQAWSMVQQLARQQAALRQIAELAARDAPGAQVLEAVAVQASNLTGVQFTTVLRYEPDGSTEIVALSGAPAGLQPGMRAPAGGEGAVQRVWRTHRTARIDNLEGVSGRWPQIAHQSGFSTSTAVPIKIHSLLWGTLVAVGREEAPSMSVEEDLTGFAELAGTAISAAQARNELRALADEQAALRRVAELVARGAALDDVFQAVTIETAKLVGGSHASLHRHERDGTATTVATYHAGPATTAGAGTELTVLVVVEARTWGALTTSTTGPPVPERTEERLNQFAGLAAAAIANAENKAHLTASRARVVATADETRRRLQRDVHDGAQQRLVQTIITLKIARDAVALGKTPGQEISEALYHAERANAELRDLVHGILPASLTQGGLRTGLESLISDLSIPVDLRMTVPRLSGQIETTVYFFVAEALTNVVKHARATHAEVTVDIDGPTLRAEVRDDGIGGADPAGGSGLTGLSDRIQAADGTLTWTSAAGAGTIVRAALPLGESES